jgi:hypothetical protein
MGYRLFEILAPRLLITIGSAAGFGQQLGQIRTITGDPRKVLGGFEILLVGEHEEAGTTAGGHLLADLDDVVASLA